MHKQSIETTRLILQQTIPKKFKKPLDWALENINFSKDVTSERTNFDLGLTPYLGDVINSWDLGGKKREVTVVAPEQTGKTLSWLIPLLWSFQYMPCLSLICYTSDDKAEEINSQKIKPLMQNIPDLASELVLPKTTRKDCYNFANFKSYFQGSGSRVTSVSAKICVADEVDDWASFEGRIDNLQDLRKRGRSFSESILAKVCSPTKKTGRIWQEFLDSSQGYWHLRCYGCNELTIRSCDVHNLQWEMNENDSIEIDSIRLICPRCGHEHNETRKYEMTQKGGFIHRYPERLDKHVGYQWGAFACLMEYFSWENIAHAQLKAGKSSNLQSQMFFDNSMRGLPFSNRTKMTGHKQALYNHKVSTYPANNEILYRFLSVDTQDDCFYWIVRGIDINNNTYLLDYGIAKTTPALTDVWNDIYSGEHLTAGIIDSGGHRTREIVDYVKDKAGLYLYKGNSRTQARFRLSSSSGKLILANPKVYQNELLYYLYNHKAKGSNYFYIPSDVKDVYVNQLIDVQPDIKVKNGDAYENWSSVSRKDHFFDCEKMFLVIKEYIITNIKRKNSKKAQKSRKKIKHTS